MYQSILQFFVLRASIIFATAVAEVIPIDVGKTPLKFSPETIEANVGDVLEFRFHPQAHSVVLGDYSRPCSPAEHGGFFSGFVPVEAGDISDEVFRVTVNHTEPMFFYCSQGNHCPQGMVGAVNPSAEQTMHNYAHNAAGRPVLSPFPDEPFGGTFGDAASEPGYQDSTCSFTTTASSPAATSSTAENSASRQQAGDEDVKSGGRLISGSSAWGLVVLLLAVGMM